MKVNLLKVIQARIEELLEYRYCEKDELTSAYLSVMLASRQADLPALRLAVEEMRSLPLPGEWKDIARLRLECLENTIDKKLLEKLESYSANTHFDLLFRGECAFVCAQALEQIESHKESRDLYGRAIKYFEEAGAGRKAVKSLQNFVVQESRLKPEASYVNDYQLVYRKAKKVREYAVAGLALNNISREYQRLGALKAALKFCNRALIFLEREHGSRCFYLALAHRCHLLIELGRTAEAEVDFQELTLSSFTEIKEASLLLEQLLFGHASRSPNKSQLYGTWKERLQQAKQSKKRGSKSPQSGGDLENQVIQLLHARASTKFELMEKLYGKKIDIQSAENRLKNLLNRIRKKFPGSLVFQDGKYHWAGGSVLSA